jgi:hypothetical protein
LWAWRIRDHPGSLAGFDILDLEVATVGNNVDLLDSRISFAGMAVCVSRPRSST